MKILFAGATGFLGSHLLPYICSYGQVYALTRFPERNLDKVKQCPNLKFIKGDLTQNGDWQEKVAGEKWDWVINLAGENIFGRWSKKKKQKIYDSRIKATENLITAITNKPSVLINASAVGIYGDCGVKEITENYVTGEDELALIVEEWERVVEDYSDSFNRVVILRTGVVLAQDALLVRKFLLPLKFFLGGYPGNGKFYFPWIHIKDYINSVLFLLKNESLSGPFNITSPNPVYFKEFCKVIGKSLHRPCWLPVPRLFVKLAVGELAEFMTFSQRVIPQKLLDNGFQFEYPYIEDAVKSILSGQQD